MSNEDPTTSGTPARRTPRQGAGGAPLGSTISIVLAVVAVVVGFLILNNITGNGGGSSADGTEPSDSLVDVIDPGEIGSTTTSSTTEPPLVTAGASVLVANMSGVAQSAGAMTDELAAQTFVMVTPAINSTLPSAEATIVQYDPSNPAALAVAESVARLMGGVTVAEVGAPPDVDGGSLNGAGVLVLLGSNEANKTLAQLGATTATATVTPSGGDADDDTTG